MFDALGSYRGQCLQFNRIQIYAVDVVIAPSGEIALKVCESIHGVFHCNRHEESPSDYFTRVSLLSTRNFF
jgi:hypothetical protein